MTKAERPRPVGERDRFEALAKKLVAVPKKEIDKRAAAYERRKARKKPG
jgi:hypothetical protein